VLGQFRARRRTIALSSRSLFSRILPGRRRRSSSGTIFSQSHWRQSWRRQWRYWRRKFAQEFTQEFVQEFREFFQPAKSYRRPLLKREWRQLRQAANSVTFDVSLRYSLVLTASVLVSASLLGSSYWVYAQIFQDLPSPMDLVEREQILTTKILDRHGRPLFRIYKNENRTLVPLESLPQHMINATIAIEDQDFYDHHGFSPRGIVRAAIANYEGRSFQGGSTITQQLVKNRLLSSERTVQRKLRELIVSVLVEGTFSKQEILEMYLNEVAYGGSVYGIEEAAQRYFGKPAAQLTLAESALLAGLPAAPSIFTPFGNRPELAYARQEEVLRRMVEEGFITPLEAAAARGEILRFRPDTIDIKAPHFVMYVKNILAQRYGEELLTKGGLEVRTTLDLDLHNLAQQAVSDEIDRLTALNVGNGAGLITNPSTGEILAMVGSKNYFDFDNDGQVNCTLCPRQPGSSIKPITYALAFENGRTPSSLINDSPVSYQGAGSPPYSPNNYDGRFHGRITLRQALASSYNVPAVKLLNELGVDNLINKAEKMGITTWENRDRFGLSLTLGGGEVRMIDMAQVYGAFANGGYSVDLDPILEITDSNGRVLLYNSCALDGRGCQRRQTVDPRVAYQITDILSDNRARSQAFGLHSVLNIPGQQVAVKTGTTNNLKDNWTIGYTSERLVAVWVGNNNGQPMSRVASGITGASPIWNNIMRRLLDDNQPHLFTKADGLIKVAVCAPTGTLACQGCPLVNEEYFIPGTQPERACNPEQFRPKPESQPDHQPQETAAGQLPGGA